jgi:DNA polymerase delta subunit 1
MSYFIITKSLRGYYKNPQGIAHKVLADRIGDRDPGNRPKPGDRIPFAYRKIDDKPDLVGHYKNGKPKYKKKHILQGDRVEDPSYIIKHNLPLDFEFYITNQIMKPVKQVLDLGMNEAETELLFQK